MNPKTVQKRKAPITAIVIQHALTNRGCGNRRRYNRRIETLVRNKEIEYIGTLTQNGCSSKSVLASFEVKTIGVKIYQKNVLLLHT
jgi:hypothetical protein